MSQEKKPANYYGGYSLYRGAAQAQPAQPMMATPANAQNARKFAAAFGGDWFGSSMMAPPMMPMAAVPANDKVAPQANVQRLPAVPPMFHNFFAPPPMMPNVYRGAPLRQQATHSAVEAPRAAPVAKRPTPATHFSGEWNAFDTVAPAHLQRHFANTHIDPIGAPNAQRPLQPIMPVASPNIASGAFSVWSTACTVNPVRARSGSSTPSEDAPRSPTMMATVASTESIGDDEEWMKQLRSTLQAVLVEDESARRTSPMKGDKEWAVQQQRHRMHHA